jgi:hypothetical protein
MQRLFLICAGVAVALPIGMPATAVEMQPGLWEVTVKAERGGVTTARPTKTRCITPEQARAAGSRTSIDLNGGTSTALRSRSGGETCKIVQSQKVGDVMTWRMQCAEPMRAEQIGRFAIDNPQHYTIVLKTMATVAQRSVTSTLTTEGRWIGECPR